MPTDRLELTDARLRAFFTSDSDGAKRLSRLGAERVRAGRRSAIAHAHVWAAVDLAFDSPFYQSTPTIIRHILTTCNDAADIKRACERWGVPLDQVFCKVKDDSGREVYELNAPAFYSTIVPVVRSYVAIRLAKLFNERNKSPLFEFLPINYTSENRIRCEIITDLVQQMVQQFGYKALLRQMILQSLLYASAFMFPLEPWYREVTRFKDKLVTVRQGLRYIIPHVTRTFVDRAYPPASINTETGAEYAGYWTVARWGEISDRRDEFFNLDSVPVGANPLDEPAMGFYLRELFPCALEFPQQDAIVGGNQRERANYSDADRDKGVLLATIFMRIVPKDYGLSDSEHPVWLRLIYASEDRVIGATVFPYRPVTYCGYDADQGRAVNPSLALEIVPFQDQLGNLLNQLILTIKRNLANVVFYDKNSIDPAQIEELRRHTQAQYSQVNFVAYDSVRDRVAQRPSGASAIHELRFTYADVNQILSAISTFMTTLERMLNFSAQELGGQATHQQSRAEVEIIAQATSQRLAYTGSFIDDAINAWKAQLYEALLKLYEGEFIAQISSDVPNAAEQLKAMGFEISGPPLRKRLPVRGDARGLRENGVPYVALIASDLPGPKQLADRQTAQAMLMAIQALASNPLLGQRIDPESVRDLVLLAARLSGADADFDVRLLPSRPDAAAAPQQVIAAVAKTVGEPLAAQIQALAKASQEQDKRIASVAEGLAAVQKALGWIVSAVQQLSGQASAPQIFPATPAPGSAQIAPEPIVGPTGPASPPQQMPAIQLPT